MKETKKIILLEKIESVISKMSGNCSFLLKLMKKPSKVKIKVTALNPLSLLPLTLTDIVFANVPLFHVIYTKNMEYF